MGPRMVSVDKNVYTSLKRLPSQRNTSDNGNVYSLPNTLSWQQSPLDRKDKGTKNFREDKGQ